jgi:diguanylate cyclase (GGDEF)-like protein
MDDMLIKDELTQQPNRRYFNTQLIRYIELFKSGRETFSLAVIDIDLFKNINDSYGHHVGDTILIEFGRFIRTQIRNTDIFARYGGEEFVIILPLTSSDTALKVLEKLRLSCADHNFEFGDSSLKLTVSIGVTGIKETDDEISLFERADSALYQAKSAGRNRIELND